jgi:hypothetical protein
MASRGGDAHPERIERILTTELHGITLKGKEGILTGTNGMEGIKRGSRKAAKARRRNEYEDRPASWPESINKEWTA